jgi:hypothetical protein
MDPSTGGQDNEPEDELEVGDEDRLPWLEAVEEEDGGGDGPSVAKLIAMIVIGLIAIGVVVGGLFWAGNRGEPGANGEVIAAPEGDYKVRPGDPGGTNFSGEGDVAAKASAGQTPQGNLNVNAVTEAPVAPAPPTPTPAPGLPAPAPQPAAPRPAPAPAASGPTIQLGAFSSPASANAAWAALARRFRYLAPLGHNIVSAQVGGRTFHRLRASGPDAAGICRRLQAAGEDCSVVN